jgi:hypothetical protein
MNAETVEQDIRAMLIEKPYLILDKVVTVNGKSAAVFEYRPNASFTKGFATPFMIHLSDLRQTVIDMLSVCHNQEELDMNIFSSAMFEYLSAEMLGNKTASLTIKDVFEDEIAGPRGKQDKIMISFVERPKKLILNKTNARAIASALGPETDAWKGATLTLAVENVKVGPNNIPSVRVKAATAKRANGSKAKAEQPALVTDDPDATQAAADTAAGLFD